MKCEIAWNPSLPTSFWTCDAKFLPAAGRDSQLVIACSRIFICISNMSVTVAGLCMWWSSYQYNQHKYYKKKNVKKNIDLLRQCHYNAVVFAKYNLWIKQTNIDCLPCTALIKWCAAKCLTQKCRIWLSPLYNIDNIVRSRMFTTIIEKMIISPV